MSLMGNHQQNLDLKHKNR